MLRELGYEFSKKIGGELRKINGGEKFTFAVTGNKASDQKHYDEVGAAVTLHLYNCFLNQPFNLVPIQLPIHETLKIQFESFIAQYPESTTMASSSSNPKSRSLRSSPRNSGKKTVKGTEEGENTLKHADDDFPIQYKKVPGCIPIFVSRDLIDNKDKLLLLIQGSGAVRPGQWARSVVINDSLEVGSMLPYVSRAQKEGFSVVIFNPNENYAQDENNSKTVIKGNETPEKHSQYVWKNVVSQSPAKEVKIVAHSYGGISTLSILSNFGKEFKERVKRIAFTDAVHSVIGLSASNKTWLKQNAINWVTSNKPLDSEEKGRINSGCPCHSAGTTQHEYTSGISIESVFRWILNGEINPPEDDIPDPKRQKTI